MSGESAFFLIVAVALLVYLVAAMLAPERFG